MEKWVTIRELSRNHGVHPETVRRWLRMGLFHAQRIGKVWLILVREVHGVYFPAEPQEGDRSNPDAARTSEEE